MKSTNVSIIRTDDSRIKQVQLWVVLVLCVGPHLLTVLHPAAYQDLAPLVTLVPLYLAQLILLWSPFRRGDLRAKHASPGSTAVRGLGLAGLLIVTALSISAIVPATSATVMPAPVRSVPASLVFFLLILLSALREELVYRVWVYGTLAQHAGAPGAIFIQASLFALMHAGYGPGGVAIAFVAAVLLGAAYDRRHDLVQIVIAHVVYNIVVYYAPGRM